MNKSLVVLLLITLIALALGCSVLSWVGSVRSVASEQGRVAELEAQVGDLQRQLAEARIEARAVATAQQARVTAEGSIKISDDVTIIALTVCGVVALFGLILSIQYSSRSDERMMMIQGAMFRRAIEAWSEAKNSAPPMLK